MLDLIKVPNYTHGELCSIWSRFPIILVVSCARFDLGFQLYSCWALLDLIKVPSYTHGELCSIWSRFPVIHVVSCKCEVDKTNGSYVFWQTVSTWFPLSPYYKLTSPTALYLIEDVAWLGTWARSCVIPEFSPRCLILKMWDLSPKLVIPICGDRKSVV